MKNWVVVGVAILIAVGVGWATMKTRPTAPSETTFTNETTVEPTGVMGEVKEFTVEGSPFKFAPNEIRVKNGDKVRVIFKNVQGTHDFTLDEFEVKTQTLSAGQSETVEFTADKAGTFEFYCSIMNHRAMGMVGKLIVE